MFIIKNIFGRMSKLYLNGMLSWLILVLTLISVLGHEVFGLSTMVIFILILILLPFAVASFINIFLIIFVNDRESNSYIIQLLSNIIFTIVVIMIYIFIFNTISRL